MSNRLITATISTKHLSTIITALETDIDAKEWTLKRHDIPKLQHRIDELKEAKAEIEKIFYR